MFGTEFFSNTGSFSCMPFDLIYFCCKSCVRFGFSWLFTCSECVSDAKAEVRAKSLSAVVPQNLRPVVRLDQLGSQKSTAPIQITCLRECLAHGDMFMVKNNVRSIKNVFTIRQRNNGRGFRSLTTPLPASQSREMSPSGGNFTSCVLRNVLCLHLANSINN